MEGCCLRLVNARLLEPASPNKMDPSYKMDEGYSEDARSTDDIESPINIDSRDHDMIAAQLQYDSGIPGAIMAMNEPERSGMHGPCYLPRDSPDSHRASV